MTAPLQNIKTILTIDDDEVTNFISQLTIEKMEITDQVIIKRNGLDALEYLTKQINNSQPIPELILLDINMPQMDGWKFLEHYSTFNKSYTTNTSIIMLSNTITDKEIKRSKAHNVMKLSTKPIDENCLKEIHYTITSNKH